MNKMNYDSYYDPILFLSKVIFLAYFSWERHLKHYGVVLPALLFIL